MRHNPRRPPPEGFSILGARGGEPKKIMPKLISKTRILPDEGQDIYVLVACEEIDNKFFNPAKDKEEKKKRLLWRFASDKNPEKEAPMFSSFSLSIWKGKKSNGLLINEALLNRTLTDKEKTEGIDTDILLGSKAYLTIKHEKGNDGEIKAKVIDIAPVPEQENIKY